MGRILDIASLDSLHLPRWRAGVDPVPESVLRTTRPDAHIVGLDDDGAVAARCCVWSRGTASLGIHRTGYIGLYQAADINQGSALLTDAAAWLRSHGADVAIGPIDGNTWRRYRLVTWRGTEPPFFLEPDNPDEWTRHFIEAGFEPIANYTSALNPDLSREDPRLGDAVKRFTQSGVTIRPIDMTRFESELRAVHRMSLASFASNFLYTPIDETAFVEQYLPIQPYVRPELVLIAESSEGVAEQPARGVVGFVFSVPDFNQRQRGVEIDTMIVKTLAVLPGRAQAGLGSVLMAMTQAAGRRLGYRRAIHALMHDSNKSMQASARTAQTMRRYSLFARTLRP